jgi:hypothetical protein
MPNVFISRVSRNDAMRRIHNMKLPLTLKCLYVHALLYLLELML